MHAKQQTTSEPEISQQPSKNGLTKIKFTGYQPEVLPHHKKLNKETLKEIINAEKDNPNICVAEAIAGFVLPNDVMFEYQDIFGNISNPCELQFSSLVLNFENKAYAKSTFELINALCYQNSGKLVAAKTKFNDLYSIIIPAACTEYFLVNVIGFEKESYSKIVRDVATLQRAQQAGNISSIKPSENPWRKEISPDTKKWVENSGVCSIDPGDAIPFDILKDTLNKHLSNELTYKEFAKWTPNKLNKDLQKGILPYKKGSYHPFSEGWLTTNQAAILLCEVLQAHEPSIVDTYKIVNELLNASRSELLKRSIALTSENPALPDELTRVSVARIQKLINIPEIAVSLPSDTLQRLSISHPDITQITQSVTEPNIERRSGDSVIQRSGEHTILWTEATRPDGPSFPSIDPRDYTSEPAKGKNP